ncbi:3024_t:CDS:2, partial [Cetraspora pellucida]
NAQLEQYESGKTNDYSSDSDKYSNNISEYESENCSDYGSEYESDNETITIETSTIKSLSSQFSKNYLLPNYGAKEGISLLDAYKRDELANRMVIHMEQGEYKKYSVIDNISEVYGLSGIHKYINGQQPLRTVIDIDASREYMESEKVNARDEEIFKKLIIATFFDSKLIHKLTREKYDKFIDRGLPGRNFCLCLIGFAKKDRVKCIFQFSLDNKWDELDHARVQPPASAGFEVRPRILSVEKINNQKKIIVGHNSLKKYANQVLQKYSDYLGSWDIEEKDSQYFIYFSRKAYLECPKCKRPHDKDQRWYGHAYGNGSFIVKCFQQNRDEGGEIFNDLSIAEKIQQKNNNNASTPSPPKIKGPKFPKPFLEMPSWVKCESPLTATEVYESQYVEPLPKEDDVYVGSPWETGKTYTLEHLTIPDSVNLLVLSTRHTYSSAVITRLNLKSYTDIDGNINLLDHQRVVCQIESLHRIINKCKCEKKYKCSPIPYDLWLDEIARRIIVMDNDLTDLNIDWIKSLRKGKQFSVIYNTYQPQKGKTFRLAPNKETVLADLWKWAKEISSLPPNERKSASLICHLRKDVQGIVHALRTDFPELCIKNYHGKSDLAEKAKDFGNVDETWKEVDLVAYTSTLKIGVSCTNHKFEQAFCLFNSYIETNAGTNQMLFRMRCIKDYVCYIEQRASNVPITEEELFNWLLKAKRESLPTELQNRGIFPDVESIIRNKDIPTIRLWVAYMLEKFRSRRLFGWRMVDFLKKAGMVVSIIKATPKAKDDTVTLTETVKGYSSAIKAEEISDIANANILNHEMAEHLENKPKKTLEEIYALNRYHIADCYGVSPESITEEFITDYDAGTNNETAVEAIIREDYRSDRLTTVTQAEKHRICLELLKTLPKMARVFDNTDASRSAKKSGLKLDKAKLGLLNSALSAIYGVKFKTTNNKNTHYHLVGTFDYEDAPKLPPYQTDEGQFYENGEDMRYGYSKLSPDELEPSPNCISQNTQDLFDIV